MAAVVKRIYDKGEDSLALQTLLFCRRMRERPLLGSAIGLAIGGVTLSLHIALSFHYEGAPFLTLYPAVVAACFLGGTMIGAVVALVNGVAQWVFFIPQADPIAIVTYAVDAMICVALIDFINRIFDLMLHLLQGKKKPVGDTTWSAANCITASRTCSPSYRRLFA